MCRQGCVGDPRKGCICSSNIGNACNLTSCGINAGCRVNYQDVPECYCPEDFPHGKPYEICKYLFCCTNNNIELYLETILYCPGCLHSSFQSFDRIVSCESNNILFIVTVSGKKENDNVFRT